MGLMFSFDWKAFSFALKFLTVLLVTAVLVQTAADFAFLTILKDQSISAINYDIQLSELFKKKREKLTASVLDSLNQEHKILKLAFVGDIMLDRRVKESIVKNGEGDYRFPFRKAANILQKYDILFGNLEGPILAGGEDQGSVYSFRMDPQSAEAIKFAGFDIVSLANNHIGDWGASGINDTISNLDAANVAHVGAGDDQRAVKYIDAKGMHIAFIAFTKVGAKGDNINFIGANSDKIIGDSIKIAEENADIVIVYFHFGEEYQIEPGEKEVELAHNAIDYGADLVIGSHPHVVRRIEKYKDKYIAYSLGNFIFDQDFAPLTMQGMLLEARVENKAITEVTGKTVKINQYFQAEIEE